MKTLCLTLLCLVFAVHALPESKPCKMPCGKPCVKSPYGTKCIKKEDCCDPSKAYFTDSPYGQVCHCRDPKQVISEAGPKGCKQDTDCRNGGNAAAYCKDNGACRCSEGFTWPGHEDHSGCFETVWGFCKGVAPNSPLVKNVEVYVSPRQPTRNSTTIALDVYSQIAREVSGGKIKYFIEHNGKPFMNNTDPLCDFVSGGCPVKVGQVQ